MTYSPTHASPPRIRRLAGQVALVTGASRGIGRAIAVRLGALGARVHLNYRSDEDAAELAATAVRAAGGVDPELQRADVGNPAEATDLVHRVLDQAGHLDIVVNNAGIQRSGMAHRMSEADWHDVIAVNLSAAFFVSRAALPGMRKAGSGCIVNVASASSFVAQAGAASYVASKHGLIGLTKALAIENAAKGVRVHAVAPGLIDTDMVRNLTEEQLAGLQARIPVGRLGAPDEVASAVAWLLTDGTYTTGNTLHLSGGVVLG